MVTEVKSSAYLQAWAQPTLSKISFGIGPKRQFTPKGEMEKDPIYAADCFVFCVFADTDPAAADVLNAESWYFYVVSISRLIKFCNLAKSVVENRVKQITTPVRYAELRNRIDATRAGRLFEGARSATATTFTSQQVKKLKTYAVWERGTRQHPVIVRASNAADAYLLARADPTLARLGTAIAGLERSRAEVDGLVANGAVDLREQERITSVTPRRPASGPR